MHEIILKVTIIIMKHKKFNNFYAYINYFIYTFLCLSWANFLRGIWKLTHVQQLGSNFLLHLTLFYSVPS